MLKVVLLVSCVAFASALIQCPPNYCDTALCASVENCLGRVRTGGSFCGCCDVCMDQLAEGDSCFQSFLLGVPATAECGEGLTCDRTTMKCAKSQKITKRAADPPCASRLKEIELSQQHGLPLLGVMKPKCDVNGYFQPVQCMGSVCYCVDTMGTTLANYQTSIGESASMNCQCALDQAAYMKTGLIGKMFYCSASGNYQGTATTAMPMVQETRPAPVVTVAPVVGGVTGTGLLSGQVFGSEAAKEACVLELKASGGSGMLGTFIPECDTDGKYAPRQCQGSECYCVRKDGTKIAGYSAAIALKPVVTCQCARDKDHYESLGLVGRIHTCRHNGNYQQYQCIGSSCYCTDDSGNRESVPPVSVANINTLKCE